MLGGWHDFYAILAMVAGTLIGAMFIVASISGRTVTPARAAAVAWFVTPTVIHLSVVLFACALLVVPTLPLRTLGMIGVTGGLIGLASCPCFLEVGPGRRVARGRLRGGERHPHGHLRADVEL